ncbi:YczE/YyaS/YitT family protein [Oceanobacillus alkalisoli]|uniref:YczE/YyaS/YitT family protein n=1 Tax=Oceanobacillus alkalisoli TaxID=2925113 RepID=UPI001F121D70|nr:YitT family protein [Oceanobacillus alkalisoli]MCF3942105.1 YitT family protein [Oceanobacillus alkalisoli]
MTKAFVYRWLFFFIGIMLLGLGASLTIKGQRFGVGSWDVLHIGLFQNLGLSIGMWSIIAGIIVITIASIGLREFPRIGTFLNMILVGLFIDFFNWLIPDPQTFPLQLVSFILGILLLGSGSGIYISADLGAGPRDSLMLLIVKKLKLSIRVARTMIEVIVAFAGFLLGGPIGLGTVIMAFGLGPVMQTALGYSKKILDDLMTEKQVSTYAGSRDGFISEDKIG